MPLTEELNYRDPLAGHVDAAIPVIDGVDLMRGAWRETVPKALESCLEYGFLTVELTAEQGGAIDSALASMRTFFARDDRFKSTVRTHGDAGWTPSNEEPAYQPGTVSNVESYDIDPDLIKAAEHALWPDVPAFRESAEQCWSEYLSLADALLELIARAAGIVPQFLVQKCDSRELNTMRFLSYPPEPGTVSDHEVGIAAHTDFECITLLYQTVPGLEVRNVNGDWLELPAQPGRLTVLLGDMLERWTNGYLQATGHRVRRTTEQRFSIVMFIAANAGVQVRPLSRFVTADRPAKYEPTEQTTHIESEMSRARSHN